MIKYIVISDGTPYAKLAKGDADDMDATWHIVSEADNFPFLRHVASLLNEYARRSADA